MASHTNRQWLGKFFNCGMRCYYCLKPLSLLPGDDQMEIATKDHLTPTSRGGTDYISNIVPACFECNRLKGNMTEAEFRKAFHTAFVSVCKGVGTADTNMTLEAREERPTNLLRKENESVSWAWRNPA